MSSFNEPTFSFTSGNIHEADTKFYTATLLVESDYPVRGGIATRSNSNTIDASLSEEPNADPVASAGLDLVDPGDGNSVSTMTDYHNSDGNDYDGGEADGAELGTGQKWYVPHDGDPETNVATLHFDASDSYDDDGDELRYEFF